MSDFAFHDTVNSTEVLVNNFLEFNKLNENKNENIIFDDDNKQIYKQIYEELKKLKLTENEIRFALTIINKIEGKRFLNQKGGDGNDLIDIKGTTVTITKRNKFLYYVLNIFFMLITFSIIKSFFQNTIQLNMKLIEDNVNQLNSALAKPNQHVDKMNSLINSLWELQGGNELATEVMLKNIKPLELPLELDSNNGMVEYNGMFTNLKNLYIKTKTILQFEPTEHFPDVKKLYTILDTATSDLKGLLSTEKGILTNLLNVFQGLDETQQKIMLYKQIVNFLPIVIASTNLEISSVVNLTSNIQSLLYGLFFRMSVMLAISTFIHTHGNKFIEPITDRKETLSLEDYNKLLKGEIKEQNKKALTILNSIFSGSNLSIPDKKMITEEIMNGLDFSKFTNLQQFTTSITAAVQEIVDELPDNNTLLLTNEEEEKNTGGKTRRKIRRNKKAKTKKRKVNKKTTKKKMKAKKKTKMNRKKSKRRRNKK